MRPDRFQRRVHRVMKPFSAAEKEVLQRAHRSGEPLNCPTCAVALDRSPVPTSPLVSYVRRRLIVICPSCHGHLVLDRPDHDLGAP